MNNTAASVRAHLTKFSRAEREVISLADDWSRP